jgi:hypothetical protein
MQEMVHGRQIRVTYLDATVEDRGVYGQIRLELGEDLEDFLKFRARLGCMAHGSELAGTLR